MGFGEVFLSFCLQGINGNRGTAEETRRQQRKPARHGQQTTYVDTTEQCRPSGAGRYLDTKNGMTMFSIGVERESAVAEYSTTLWAEPEIHGLAVTTVNACMAVNRVE